MKPVRPPMTALRQRMLEDMQLRTPLTAICAASPSSPSTRHPLETIGRCGRPGAHGKCTGYPYFAYILIAPVRCGRKLRHLLPPQRLLAGELAPRRQRRRELLLRAPLERFASRAGRLAAGETAGVAASRAGAKRRPVEFLPSPGPPASLLFP